MPAILAPSLQPGSGGLGPNAPPPTHNPTPQVHKKGTKVQSVGSNPADPNLLMTAGNDYFARLLDIRRLAGGPAPAAQAPLPDKGKAAAGAPAELCALKHPRVINAAYFSPLTGERRGKPAPVTLKKCIKAGSGTGALPCCCMLPGIWASGWTQGPGPGRRACRAQAADDVPGQQATPLGLHQRDTDRPTARPRNCERG